MENRTVNFGFDQYPRALDVDDHYGGLSMAAKMLYVKLRSRLQLSKNNGNKFRDEQGIYVIFTIQEAQKLLSCGKDKTIKAFRALEDVGLIRRRKVGYSTPLRIYVTDLLDADGSEKATDKGPDADTTNGTMSRPVKDRDEDPSYTDYSDIDDINIDHSHSLCGRAEPAKALTAELIEAYPEERREHVDEVLRTVRKLCLTDDDLRLALINLDSYKRSDQWVRDGGRYIPNICKWLRNGYWRYPAKDRMGGTGYACGRRELDADEIEAIERLFREDKNV